MADGLIDTLRFTFTTEDGDWTGTRKEYEANDDIRKYFGMQATPPVGRDTVWLGTNVFSFSRQVLERDRGRADLFDDLKRTFAENPLSYFVPQSDTVLDFLNWRYADLGNTYKILCAGNGCGKSVSAYIDVLLEIVPTDKKWPIHAIHGVRQREYRGPYTKGGVAVISYEMKNHEFTIWPQVIKAWTPYEYIRKYCEGGGTISWGRNPKVEIANTPLFFFGMSQRQPTFESQAMNIYWWDEQGDERRFAGANARVRRRGGRHVQAMTPHAIDGMPFTGAGTYVDKIRQGKMDVGLDVHFWEMSLESVSDWIYTKENKRAAIREWIEDPIATCNKAKLAEGMARVHGKFHERSGLVLDLFDEGMHLVPRFDVPKHWSLYRYHDHGRKEPCAAIMVAVNPLGQKFVVDEYYITDKEIRDNAEGIIEMSGNTVIVGPDGEREESRDGSDVIRTVGDPRSLSKTGDAGQKTIGDEYASAGLYIMPGSGKRPEHLYPLVANMMLPDMSRDHISAKAEDGLPAKGMPNLVFFDDLVNLRREITTWRMKQRAVLTKSGAAEVLEKPEAANDHLMTCLMLMAEDNPIWVPKKARDVDDVLGEQTEDEENESIIVRCKTTGY